MTAPRLLLRVYGDSLSMPRVSAKIGYLDTYAEQVAARLRTESPSTVCDLYNRSVGGAAVSELYARFASDSVYFGTPGGDVMIIQTGIVDCAPRPIPHWLREQITKLPGHARAPIIRVLHDHRARFLRLGRTWRRTQPGAFERQMRRWFGEASQRCSHLYVVNILPTHDRFERRSPGYNSSVRLYNELLAKALRETAPGATLIDAHARTMAEPNGLEKWINADDGHHLTLAGHDMVTDALCSAGPLAALTNASATR